MKQSLVDAAPDMLAALEQVMDAFKTEKIVGNIDVANFESVSKFNELLTSVYLAVVKAKGEQ